MDNQYEINGRLFSFGTIPPIEAIRVEVAIARVIGEPLFKAFMGSKAAGEGEADVAAAGAAAVGLLASKMNADELIATMQTVFNYVGVDGRARVDMNADFVGKNKELWMVFIAALRFNFRDFLPAGLLDSIRAKMPASS